MAQPTLEEVERLAAQLPVADQASLASRLMHRDASGRFVDSRSKPLAQLRDKYAGAAPPDIDVDAALRECRSEWLKEIDAVIEGGDIP